ncbi:MAG TPA: helix-turn-helix transcriptional regulator [Solirubrobacterales bacterium]|nr:helix-turn-helix transcriptional regulator [Solirubrobacterales bacterium]
MRRQSEELSYEGRARIADNVFLLRRRAGYSQEALTQRALLSTGRIGEIERGQVIAGLDSYVRLAGALSVTLDDLLAGVTWAPPVLESEVEGDYVVEFDREAPRGD